MADRKAILFIDSPTLFLHPSVSSRLWDEIEAWRNQNTFVYDTVDPVFAASRPGNVTIWIKSYQKDPEAWNYTIVDGEDQRDEFLLNLLGSRRPVLFIEGDSTHSIDYPLYSAIFNEYTIKPVGSCNKVIEATRTFGSLKPMHRLESHGLVDRDRRTDGEVSYLRLKNIMVPEVAEVENIFLSEPVVRIMASLRRQNPDKIFRQVEKEVINFFGKELERQALQHTRHRMKRDVERKIDARFTCITALELHIKGLIKKLHPRETYNMLFREFKTMYNSRDYTGILRVFNDKTLFRQSCVIKLLKFSSPDDYISGVLKAIRSNSAEGLQLKTEIRNLFNPPDFLLSNAETECASDCKSFIQSGT